MSRVTGLDKAKGFANSQASMKPSQDGPPLAKIEHALVDYLSRKPESIENLPKIGLYLRSRSLTPPDGLKQFIISKPQRFEFLEGHNGNHKVKLIGGTLLNSKKHIPPAPGLLPSTAQNNNGAYSDYAPSNDVPIGIGKIETLHSAIAKLKRNHTLPPFSIRNNFSPIKSFNR